MSFACPSSRSTFSRVRLPNDLPNELLIAVLQAEEDPMAISSSARVLERKLVVVGCTILSSVSGNLISSAIVSSSPVEVFFLVAQLFDLSSRHVLSPGILRLARSI